MDVTDIWSKGKLGTGQDSHLHLRAWTGSTLAVFRYTTGPTGANERGAAMLAAILAGARPARGTCPVATVAISGGEAGDQLTGSPEVKAPVGRAEMLGRIRQGGKQLDRS